MKNDLMCEFAYNSFVWSKSIDEVSTMNYEELLKEVQTVRAMRGDRFLKTDDEIVELVYNHARREAYHNTRLGIRDIEQLR